MADLIECATIDLRSSRGSWPSRAAHVTFVDLEPARELIADAWRPDTGHIPCRTGPARDLRDSWEVQPESFTSMIIADLLIGQREHQVLVSQICAMLEQELDAGDGLFHFFKDHARLPADADTTAMGLSVLLQAGAPVTERAHRTLDRILANTNSQGVVETYFDPTGERAGIIDPVVCVNVLYLAHQLGRERELVATLDYVHQTIVDGSYLAGTRYYHSPDTFLYFAARLVRQFPQVHWVLFRPLRAALRDRQATTSHPLDLAQRVIAANWLGLPLGLDGADESRELVESQELDGCWPSDSMFRYGRKQIYFGSRALTSAFAIRALQGRRFHTHTPVTRTRSDRFRPLLAEAAHV
jgi:hypothetical protein